MRKLLQTKKKYTSWHQGSIRSEGNLRIMQGNEIMGFRFFKEFSESAPRTSIKRSWEAEPAQVHDLAQGIEPGEFVLGEIEKVELHVYYRKRIT